MTVRTGAAISKLVLGERLPMEWGSLLALPTATVVNPKRDINVGVPYRPPVRTN